LTVSVNLADSNVGRAAAVVALGSHNLIVVGAQAHAKLTPSIEVVGGGHGTAGTLALTDRPVLLEGSSTNDGWLVGTGRDVDVVSSAIAGDGSLLGATRTRVVGTVRLDDVVLNERVGRPAVDGEVAVAIGVVGTREVDGPGS
jgi:hypothetical protein